MQDCDSREIGFSVEGALLLIIILTQIRLWLTLGERIRCWCRGCNMLVSKSSNVYRQINSWRTTREAVLISVNCVFRFHVQSSREGTGLKTAGQLFIIEAEESSDKFCTFYLLMGDRKTRQGSSLLSSVLWKDKNLSSYIRQSYEEDIKVYYNCRSNLRHIVYNSLQQCFLASSLSTSSRNNFWHSEYSSQE